MLSTRQFEEALGPKIGQEIGLTEWIKYDQAQVDAHGQLTGDDGPIHSDPEWAARETGFGGSIVQGSLLLSTFTRMAKSLEWPDGDLAYRMNYGFNRVRIIRPVKTAQHFRGRFRLKESRPKSDLALLVTMDATIETEGSEQPAIAAEWLAYLQFNK